MKKKVSIAAIGVVGIILLTACTNHTVENQGQATLDQINTSVGMTLTAANLNITDTTMPTDTQTETPPATATLAAHLPTATVYYISTSTSCDNAAYVSDVTIPDNTMVAPGQAFIKTWMIKNTGTCTWSTSYSINHSSGNTMSGESTALEESVAPGSSVEVSVAMVAPTTSGTCTGYWIMQNAGGSAFGGYVTVIIVVSSSAATITPTPTITATVTVTSAATATPSATTEPTATIMPTVTDTVVLEVTSEPE